MASLKSTSIDAELRVTLELTESEVRALDALFGYGEDRFLQVFYQEMGTAYLKPHENGIRSLHQTIRDITSGPLAKIDVARKSMYEGMKK